MAAYISTCKLPKIIAVSIIIWKGFFLSSDCWLKLSIKAVNCSEMYLFQLANTLVVLPDPNDDMREERHGMFKIYDVCMDVCFCSG